MKPTYVTKVIFITVCKWACPQYTTDCSVAAISTPEADTVTLKDINMIKHTIFIFYF